MFDEVACQQRAVLTQCSAASESQRHALSDELLSISLLSWMALVRTVKNHWGWGVTRWLRLRCRTLKLLKSSMFKIKLFSKKSSANTKVHENNILCCFTESGCFDHYQIIWSIRRLQRANLVSYNFWTFIKLFGQEKPSARMLTFFHDSNFTVTKSHAPPAKHEEAVCLPSFKAPSFKGKHLWLKQRQSYGRIVAYHRLHSHTIRVIPEWHWFVGTNTKNHLQLNTINTFKA